jgi:GNAT superfamily N-acetyltransferase
MLTVDSGRPGGDASDLANEQRGLVTQPETEVRPLKEGDLVNADRIFRVAFGTFLGAPEPDKFFGDCDYVNTRWRTNPNSAFGAWRGGQFLGSNFATNWGSVGYFGPLTVDPTYWEQKVAQRLLEPVIDLFDAWGTKLAGLFTFSHSPKHVSLYQKFGFMPRHLTMLMSKPVLAGTPSTEFERLSTATVGERESIIAACNELTSRVFEGLSVETELRSVLSQSLGDAVLVHDSVGLAGLAVCHTGPGTEAGGGACFVKFAAVRPGSNAPANFQDLMSACHQFALAREAKTLVAGVNAAREQCYRQLLLDGYRIDMQGVAMTRESDRNYNRVDAFLIDDWR